MKRAALLLIRGYQRWLSPVLPAACRYEPTCSRYTYEAIERYGLQRGSGLAGRRLLRCTPFHAGGYDPVPQIDTSEAHIRADDADGASPVTSVGAIDPTPAPRRDCDTDSGLRSRPSQRP